MTRGKLLMLIVVVVLLTLWLGRRPLLTAVARWLDIGSQPEATDYVFVLNGDVNARPFVGAALVKAGYAPKVLLVPMAERVKSETDPTPPIHEITRQVLIRRGVAPDAIELMDGMVASTFDEAKALGKHLEKIDHHDATVAIVTSNFHTRRTRWVFRKAFDGPAENLHFVSTPTHGYDATNWWRVEDGFATYPTEYLKFGFYVFHYGNGFRYSALAAGLGCVAVALFAWRKKRTPVELTPHAA